MIRAGTSARVLAALSMLALIEAAPARDAAAAEDSHARMRRELAAIAARRAVWNPFFWDDRLGELQARAAGLAPDAPLLDRFSALSELGLVELKTGSVDRGIAALSAARDLLPETARSERAQLAFHLGLAHLRLAEQSNCRHHPSPRSCILPISGDGVHHDQESTRRAIAWLGEVLDLVPAQTVEHLATQWLLNIAYQSAGFSQAEIPEDRRLPASVYASDQEFSKLPNVAAELGLDAFDQAGGAVVDDLDGDDRLDVLTSTWTPDGALKLRLNRGAAGFVDRTVEAGLAGITGGLNLVHADYDNDGDADVLVLRGAWLGDQGRHPNSLLQNDGSGRFRDVTFSAGLGDEWYPTQTAAWADYDNDGWLDLYVGNEGGPGRFPGQLFHNNGDGTFTDVARAAGVENFRFAKGVAWGDYDSDGDQDLYVSNWPEPNRLYRNHGDGTFEDVAAQLGVTGPLASFPAWFWDFDNDGALDLYVAGFPYRPEAGLGNLFVVVASYLGMRSPFETGRLYRNDGAGGFEDVSESFGLTRVNMTMGANFGDLDGDGYLDFYLGTGYPEYDGLVPNLFYRNDRGRRFLDVTMAAGVGHLQKGHGVVFADLDDDGDVDLFEQMGGFFPEDSFHNVLYENPGFGSRWIRIKLVGRRSNRAGVGARLRLSVVEDGETREIYRHVGSGGSFGSGPRGQHVGLGSATRLARLEVAWPASGALQVFPDVPLDSAFEIIEGETALRCLPPGRCGAADRPAPRTENGPR